MKMIVEPNGAYSEQYYGFTKREVKLILPYIRNAARAFYSLVGAYLFAPGMITVHCKCIVIYRHLQPPPYNPQWRVVKVNGVLMVRIPTYYKRVYKNETGGYTTEYSIKPFKHEPDTQSNPR